MRNLLLSRQQLLIAALFCTGLTVASAVENISVLMIGNSYAAGTWQGFKGFLDADPDVNAILSTVTPGGKQLWQHNEDTSTRNTITNGGSWDFVILQEQSQIPAFAAYEQAWWDTFYDDGAKPLTDMAIGAGAKVVLFQTWARATNDTDTLQYFGFDPVIMQEALSYSYGWAGTFLGVKVAPVGEAWEDALQANPSLGLHTSDRSHPNSNGAYLTGAVLYETITGKRSSDVNYLGGLSQAHADFFRSIAFGVLPQPNLDIDPQLGNDGITVSEEMTTGTVVHTVSAMPYNGNDGTVPITRYDILEGNEEGVFSLDSSNGELSVIGSLSTSNTPTYTLRLLATDAKNWCDDGILTVKVATAFSYWMGDYTVAENDPHDDPDGDTVMNRDEWLGDTDPSNSNSFLRLSSDLVPVTGQQRIFFDSSAERVYQLDCTTDLESPSWLRVRTNWLGTGAAMEWIAPGSFGTCYYRLTAGRP